MSKLLFRDNMTVYQHDIKNLENDRSRRSVKPSFHAVPNFVNVGSGSHPINKAQVVNERVY
jgi:hypothetical protein